MKSMQCQTSLCSRCQNYTPEGRRGGQCSLLGAPVKGSWKACSLAMPVFLSQDTVVKSLEALLQPAEVDIQVADKKQMLETFYLVKT